MSDLGCSTRNTSVNFDPSNLENFQAPSVDPLPRSDMNLCELTYTIPKFKDNSARPLLVKMTRPNDVQSILSGRRKLADMPGIRIKPDLSPEDRKVESLLLKERRSQINAGVDRSAIRISGASLFVNKRKFGCVTGGIFQRSSESSPGPHQAGLTVVETLKLTKRVIPLN